MTSTARWRARARRGFVPTFELLEDRRLLTAGLFIQGTTLLSPCGNPLPGALVQLFAANDLVHPLGQVVTGADAKYEFSDSNVTGGLNAGIPYKIVQTPPDGYANAGVQVKSQVDAAEAVDARTIQVTLADPASIRMNYSFSSITSGAFGQNLYAVFVPRYGCEPGYVYAGQLPVTVTSSLGAQSFSTFCVDLFHDLTNADGQVYAMKPMSTSQATNGNTPPQSVLHAGEIAYLYNHYASAGLDARSSAALQMAIWKLEYDNDANLSFSTGNFQDSTDTAVIEIANRFISEARGKNEQVEFLALNDPNSCGHGQGILAAKSYNFTNVLAASVSGFVFTDINSNGIEERGETGIPNVTLTLTGTNNLGHTVCLTTRTDSQGAYSFTNLHPGTYTVRETQPAGYGSSTSNTHGGPLASGDKVTGQNFGETTGKLSGTVYFDKDSSGSLTTGDVGLGGICLTLTGTDATGAPVNRSTTTAADGTYSFCGLLAGTYQVTEGATAGYNQGTNTAGLPVNGTVSGDVISNIVLTATTANAPALTPAFNAVAYNYGETGAPISGRVFRDCNTNGILDPGEIGLPGVTVTLKKASCGNLIATTTTGSDGAYTFTNQAPDSYIIEENQPAGYGSSTPNALNVTLSASGLTGQNFGETLGKLSGTVYFDKDSSGSLTTGDVGLGGICLTLTGTDATGAPVNRSTTTAADGTYSFCGLLAGTYQVTEGATAGYNQGTNTAGLPVNGTVSGDVISNIVLTATTANAPTLTPAFNAVAYNFGEAGASISGTVFIDNNSNGVRDSCEAGLGGVTISLKDSKGSVIATATTAVNGSYALSNIPPGQYTLVETQPAGYGSSTPNTLNVSLGAAGLAGQNFGEVATACQSVAPGDTARIDFWGSQSGQSLINSLNGGPTAKNLATWLATNFPYLYGVKAGSTNNLTGKTNADVAALFRLYLSPSGSQVNAQIMSAALAVYVTNTTLAGDLAANWGFNVSATGTGAKTFNVGSYGSAIGLKNNTSYSVLSLLQQANLRKQKGSFNSSAFCSLFARLNQAGDP